MDATQIISKKLNGDILSDSELEFIILSYVQNKIDDGQMTDFLRSVKKNGMTMKAKKDTQQIKDFICIETEDLFLKPLGLV